MHTTILRNRDGKELGRITPLGKELVLHNRQGVELGRYNMIQDTTRDTAGRLVGRGNLLTYLLAT